MSNEKILEVLKDEAFAKSILEMQTQEQVQAAFKERGIEISKEDIGIIGDIINKMIEKNSTQLSEQDLKEIAGGDYGVLDFGKDFVIGAAGLPLAHFMDGGYSGVYHEGGENDSFNHVRIAGAVTAGLGAAGGAAAGGYGIYKLVKWAKNRKKSAK